MRRRRWRNAALVALLIAAWLLLGLPGLPGGKTPALAPAPVPPVAAAPAVPPPTSEVRPPASAAASAPEPVAEKSPEPEPEPPADRFGGGMFALHGALQGGRLGAAWAALESLQALVLPADMAALRSAASAAVRARQDELLAELARSVCSGRVLAAHRALAGMLRPARPQVDDALRRLAQAHGWPGLARGPVPAGAAVPAPAPLPPDRAVRLWLDQRESPGRVASVARGGEVSVRFRRAGRVEFAFVPRVQLEPVAASAGEALDAARCALRGGDATLASLWLCYAADRGAPAEAIGALARRLGL